MNFWGLKPGVFGLLREGFAQFLKEKGHEPKSEYFIPLLINENVRNNRISTRVLSCNSPWFGVTYREDKPGAEASIRELVARGVYPPVLW